MILIGRINSFQFIPESQTEDQSKDFSFILLEFISPFDLEKFSKVHQTASSFYNWQLSISITFARKRGGERSHE